MKITIITINYNNAYGIRKTIESVLNQKFEDYEYVIIDGLSDDNSVNIAKSYIDKFLDKNIKYTIISEKDTGIYNAMNKGIDLAHGEYINFMNSGDRLANDNILEDISVLLDNIDILYGDSFSVNGKGNINDYHYGTPIENIMKGIPFCHQSSFIKRELAQEYKFNEKYKIQADYDMFLRMYLDGKTYKQVYKFLSIYEKNGISSRINHEDEIIRQDNGVKEYQKNKLSIFKDSIKRLIRKITPICVIKWKHNYLRRKTKCY